jgi:acetylserotonin N-methyltransferase
MAHGMSDPAAILDLIEGFRRSKTLFAAVELGFFDGARPSGAAMDRLLDACVSLGLLEKGGGEYVNTALAEEYLRQSSPQSLRGYIRYANTILYPMWMHLEDAVVEGTPRWRQTFGAAGTGNLARLARRAGGLFSNFFHSDRSRRDFMAGIYGLGAISSPKVAAAFDLSRFHRLVDLGGSTGHLALAVRERYPEMRVCVFDLPEVIAVTREYAGGRADLIAGDFFQDPLPPADLYSLGKILHAWSEDRIQQLLARVYAALPDRGGLLVAERLLHKDRGGPLNVHMHSLNMLVATEGRERTLSEYRALLEKVGFREIQARQTGAVTDAILAIK